jgi:hypothetical protein
MRFFTHPAFISTTLLSRSSLHLCQDNVQFREVSISRNPNCTAWHVSRSPHALLHASCLHKHHITVRELAASLLGQGTTQCVKEQRDALAHQKKLFWIPLEDTTRRLMTDSEDNRPLLHPEGQLVHDMEREACTGKRGALLRDMEDTRLHYSYMPNSREGRPTLGHMSKMCNREDRS